MNDDHKLGRTAANRRKERRRSTTATSREFVSAGRDETTASGQRGRSSPSGKRELSRRSGSREYTVRSRTARLSERELSVESRCGAVAVGSVCLLPPLSSGGARVTLP